MRMLSVPCGEYNSQGYADLEEAVALARQQGIVNVQGAISEEVLWPLFSLGTMIGMDLSAEVPGIGNGHGANGVSVKMVQPLATPNLLRGLLQGVEGQITRAAGSDLPHWQPTLSPTGVRMVLMGNGAVFRDHTDDYEGLVASVQMDVQGQKTMRARMNGEWQVANVAKGDVTLFAGDTFSPAPRTRHGFTFTGAYAVAFTLGQDPFYSISGRFPLLEENPQYLADIIQNHPHLLSRLKPTPQ